MPTASTTAPEESYERAVRLNLTYREWDILTEVLSYRLGPPIDWYRASQITVLAGPADTLTEDLLLEIADGIGELEQEYSSGGMYDDAEEARSASSKVSRGEVEPWEEAVADLNATPPAEMSLEELRDEYEDLLGPLRARPSDMVANHPALRRRAVALWAAVRDRVDRRPPECPICQSDSWWPAFTEPIKCNECGHRADRDLEAEVFPTWQRMLGVGDE